MQNIDTSQNHAVSASNVPSVTSPGAPQSVQAGQQSQFNAPNLQQLNTPQQHQQHPTSLPQNEQNQPQRTSETKTQQPDEENSQASMANTAIPNAATNGQENSMDTGLDLEQLMMDNDLDMFTDMGMEGMDVDSFGAGLFAGLGSVDEPKSIQQQIASGPLIEYCSLSGHTNKVNTCDFSSDGILFATAGHDKKVLIWNTLTKALDRTLEGHASQITSARFSNHGTTSASNSIRLLATASYDKTVRIWNLAGDNAECHGILNVGNTVMSVDFCQNGEICCSLDAEGELKVWNVMTRVCERSLKLGKNPNTFCNNPIRSHPSQPCTVAAAVGSDLYILSVSLSSLELLRELPTSHSKIIHTIEWSPDGAYLLTASEDSISVWDTLNFKVMYHQAHTTGKISSCTFLPPSSASSHSLISPTSPLSAASDKNAANATTMLVYGDYENMFVWQFAGSSGNNLIGGTGNKPVPISGAHQGGYVSCITACVLPADGSEIGGNVFVGSVCSSKNGGGKIWQMM